jgi:hypothetical protein
MYIIISLLAIGIITYFGYIFYRDHRQTFKTTSKTILVMFVIGVLYFYFKDTGNPTEKAIAFNNLKETNKERKQNEDIDALIAKLESANKLKDHCAVGLSKKERLERLGQYGAIRETGPGEVYRTPDGEHVLVLFSSGKVAHCH